MQAAPQRGDLQLLSLLTATPFTRSFYAKNSSLLHLLILQRSLVGRYARLTTWNVPICAWFYELQMLSLQHNI